MGYKAKVKMFRKLLGGDKRPTKLEDMIACPVCHAWSYPRAIRDPKNDTEREAILCGSCHIDLMPYIKTQQAAEAAAKQKETLKSIEMPTDNPKDAPIEIGTEIGKIQQISFESEEERQKEIDRLTAKRDAYLEKHPEIEGEQNEVRSTVPQS